MFVNVSFSRHPGNQLASADRLHNQGYPRLFDSRYAKLIAIVPLSLWLLGCAQSIEQQVSGRLSVSGSTVGNAELRLYESQLCSGNFTETTANKDGRFSFRTRTISGTISEFKQELTLCQKQNGFWRALWASAHRAGASSIDLTCAIQKEGKAVCEPKFNYGV